MPEGAIDRAIEAVADRTPVDWDELERDIGNDDERDWLEWVRVLGEIAAFHNSADAGAEPVESRIGRVAPAGENPDETSSQKWGRYRLLEQVGEGSFAIVHRAWDPELEREVAVKILHRRVTDTLSTERLLREGRALARIGHPHVVSVLGVESHEGQVALCMEFVRGETLEDAIQHHGTLSAREAALVGGDVCGALAAVHAAGFVHRDVKARNVMRETGGRIVLMDFGATAAVSTSVGVRTVGTPLYLAPELINGGSPSLSGDIYSLGILLYYLVSGEYPVVGATLDELRDAHAHKRRRRLRDVRPDLPAEFVRAIDAATAIRPEERPDSAGAMEDLLDRVVGTASHAVPSPRADPRTSLAVLPFVDVSSDSTLEYLCDGIAEELSNALAAVPGLRVVARSSSVRFKGKSEDVRQVGSALNVGTVLEGSVRAVGNQLRVVSRLVDAHDGFQIWSERFDRRLDDVFAVQDDIARAVVDALRVHGDRDEGSEVIVPGTPSTRDFEAYTLYLKGRHHWNKRTEANLHNSVRYFQAAIDRDAGYAEAYAGLADAQTTLGLYGALAPKAAMPNAKVAAQQALDLQPSLSGALAAWGCVTGVYEWSWGKAEHYYSRAIELNPGDSGARHWYAINHLVPLKRFDEAAEELRRARETDPLSVPISVSVGLLAYFAHRYPEAHDRLSETFEFDPHAATARLFFGLTLVEMKRFDEAIPELRTAIRLTAKSPETSAALAYAHARAGHVDRAREGMAELTNLSAQRYISPSLVAQIHAGLGDKELALDWLGRAFEVRAADLAWLAVRPVFDGLRSETRFTGLLDRLGQ